MPRHVYFGLAGRRTKKEGKAEPAATRISRITFCDERVSRFRPLSNAWTSLFFYVRCFVKMAPLNVQFIWDSLGLRRFGVFVCV